MNSAIHGSDFGLSASVKKSTHNNKFIMETSCSILNACRIKRTQEYTQLHLRCGTGNFTNNLQKKSQYVNKVFRWHGFIG